MNGLILSIGGAIIAAMSLVSRNSTSNCPADQLAAPYFLLAGAVLFVIGVAVAGRKGSSNCP